MTDGQVFMLTLAAVTAAGFIVCGLFGWGRDRLADRRSRGTVTVEIVVDATAYQEAIERVQAAIATAHQRRQPVVLVQTFEGDAEVPLRDLDVEAVRRARP